MSEQKLNKIFSNLVTVIDCQAENYLETAPFHPDQQYPEYPFAGQLSDQANPIYASLRQAFWQLAMDRDNFGKAGWNPLAELVQKGDNVVLKPNYVQHVNYREKDLNSVIVHSSLLRAVIDYLLIALKGSGQITIADAPLWDADFETIVQQMKVRELIDFYRQQKIEIKLIDMRRMTVVQKNGLVVKRNYNQQMIERSRVIDLAENSQFKDFAQHSARLNGMDYDRLETVKHHSAGRHEYCVSQIILDADLIINLPKLKTHKKSGVTLSMKNLVGINVDKNFLPHYRIGTPAEGGDEYPNVKGKLRKFFHHTLRFSIDNLLMRGEKIMVPLLSPLFSLIGWLNRRLQKNREEAAFKSTHPGFNQMVINSIYKFFLGSEIRAGNWEGNDTIWRMIQDLNRILIYCDKDGNICSTPQRRYFSIIDGLIGGEKDGPMNPDPVKAGAIIVGFNPYHVDCAAIQLMGLNYQKLKVLNALDFQHKLAIAQQRETKIVSNKDSWQNGISYNDSKKFEPHYAWSSIKGVS